MTRTALIMAGGRGDRMARSGVAEPKPLVPVAGVTLLEWNLRLLIGSGIDRVVVSVAERDARVRQFVADRLGLIGERAGVAVDELVEEPPLGNIGPAGLLAGSVDSLLVVYADNLTGVDLCQIYDDHLADDVDLTLAAHREAFAMPFGELTVDVAHPDRLVAYTEKPTHVLLVSSAVMVLGPRAIERAGAEVPLGISQLAQALVDEGGQVRLWSHDAPWVDVNDRAAIERAEALVAHHPDLFPTPDELDTIDLTRADLTRADLTRADLTSGDLALELEPYPAVRS